MPQRPIAYAATSFTLTEEERKWIDAKWQKIRRSATKADAADAKWNRISQEINDKLDREGVTDIIARTRAKNASIPLKDQLDIGKWHSGNAQRHIDDIQLFLRLKELGLL